MTILFDDPNTGGMVDYLWQWDQNRQMFVNANNATAVQAEFDTNYLYKSIVVEMSQGMNYWTCEVPNGLLQTTDTITVSIVDVSDPYTRITLAKQTVQIRPKKKPENWAYTPGEEGAVDFIKAVKQVSDAKKDIDATVVKLAESLKQIKANTDAIETLRKIIGGDAMLPSVESPTRW